MKVFGTLKVDEFKTGFYQRIDLSDYVVFIENINQPQVVAYIKANYNAIQEAFKAKRKRFFLLSEIANKTDIQEPLSYIYPRLNNSIEAGSFNSFILKNYLGYKGDITTGLLSIDYTSVFLEFESDVVDDFKQLVKTYLNSVCNEDDDYMLSSEDNSDDSIELDEETKARVNSILEAFRALSQSGQLLIALPLVEAYLKEQTSSALTDLSPVKIDAEYNIYLTEYNNLEIKLSHLTKSIYILFLNHPEGILLTDLNLYKKELLALYKKISNRLDFDKMNDSIEELVDTNTNAIYVHLSRIKSAFTKAVHHSIAKHYFIDGAKNKPKTISLNRDLVTSND